MKISYFVSGLLGAYALLFSAAASAQVVARADVVAGVRPQLEAVLALANSNLKVTSIFHRHDLKLADGEVTWQVDVDPGSLKPGRRTVQVTALVEGIPEATTKVATVIKGYLDVPVARHNLKRGSSVIASDIEYKRIEVTRPIDGLVGDKEDVVGMMTLRAVREGVPLRMKWFDAPLAIERGESVKVKLVRGGLVINATAIALGKGRVGDTIQLRNPESHIRYEARVSAPGQARIQSW